MKKKSNSQSFSRPKKIGAATKDYRFFVIAAVFLILAVAFTVYMGMVQSRGPTKEYESYDIRTETVSGKRGKIYDRNGVLLVDNSPYYDFVFEYGAMAYSPKEVNSALLTCLRALEITDNTDKRATDYFVLKGTYPNVAFAEGISDTSKNLGYYYDRFLIRHELSKDISSADFARFFVDKYELDKHGYTDKQITELIRIYYDMDRVGFGAFQSYTIAERLMPSDENDMSLLTTVKEKRVEGATFIQRTERVICHEGYAQHILGSVGKIYAEEAEKYTDLGYSLNATVGKSGCELAFEEYLRGKDGTLVTKYDKDGTLLEEYYEPAPTDGYDVYLTIDIELQKIAEDSLKDEVESLTHSEAGAATVIDPNTGEVLAMASFSTYTQQNLALYGLFAPGSTYKIGTALAALEEKHISDFSKYVCTKECSFGPDCLGLHGSISVTDAIAVSCNLFFDYLGIEMGLDKITPYTKKLGLGAATGIELGEAVGTVASSAYADTLDSYVWREFDNASGAIGQSLHAYTPLQLSVYMSSVVNHGTRYSAHLLDSLHEYGKKEAITAIKPEVADTLVFSDSTYSTLIKGMRAVVTSSDALRGYFADVSAAVGGKTGTAQTGAQHDNALFSGFAPLDSPEIVASCVLEEGEVGNNAAKVVAKIFEAYFDLKEERNKPQE